MYIVQVAPTSYEPVRVVGSGERLVLNLDKALRSAAAVQGLKLRTEVVSLNAAESKISQPSVHRMADVPWTAENVRAEPLIEAFRPADAVYVHRCMTQAGLFVAAHARLLGKRVFGSDVGAGEAAILQWAPDIMRLYCGLHSTSRYAALAFSGMGVPVHVIPAPLDSEFHAPGVNGRDGQLVLGIGRVVPQKGYERTIRALPSSLSLVIVGQHCDASYIAFLRECAHGKSVQFVDHLDDIAVRNLLLRASMFVHASTHVDYLGRFYHRPESLGLAPLEAIASGTATLVSNAGSLPELGSLPGCHVFGSEAELASLLQDVACGRQSYVDPLEMHRAATDNYGLVATGTALLDMLKSSAPCAFSF